MKRGGGWLVGWVRFFSSFALGWEEWLLWIARNPHQGNGRTTAGWACWLGRRWLFSMSCGARYWTCCWVYRGWLAHLEHPHPAGLGVGWLGWGYRWMYKEGGGPEKGAFIRFFLLLLHRTTPNFGMALVKTKCEFRFGFRIMASTRWGRTWDFSYLVCRELENYVVLIMP